MSVLIGTAGWSLPLAEQGYFPEGETHLHRYAQKFLVTEINSTFRRSHRASSYVRWQNSVPPEFRFSVKAPKGITHDRRLRKCKSLFKAFFMDVSGLGNKLGCLLVQLPPSLTFERPVVDEFFGMVRELTNLSVVCEPRNASWFSTEAEKLLQQREISRVAADPAIVPQAGEGGAWKGLLYYRLHGSPRPYYSAYSASYLAALSKRLRHEAEKVPVWCIFDNTTLGAATSNARELGSLCAQKVRG